MTTTTDRRWLALAVIGVAVAAMLPRPAPLVQREPV